MAHAIPVWSSLAPHAGAYDAWLCDIWGVLHDGAAAFPAARDACIAYRRQGGIVLLVSNAPRPAAAVAAQLAGLGITADCFDAILTSGDVTRGLLGRMPRQRLYLLGPERHRALVDGIDHDLVAHGDADLVLCSGLFEHDPDETPEQYTAHLAALAARRLPLLCANPDLHAQSGARLLPCAGSLAAIYERLGGAVTYAGKPHGEVYGTARAMLAQKAGRSIPDARILAIGDGLHTDIRGAGTEGLPSLYVASRVHLTEPFSADAVARLFAGHPHRPSAATPALAW